MKSIWKSWTFWYNVITALVAILTALSNEAWLADEYKELVLGIIAFLNGAGNILLRFITVAPVAAPKPLQSIQQKRMNGDK